MDDRFFTISIKRIGLRARKRSPLLEDIVQVEFGKGHREMFFKTAFIQEQLIQCDFLINKFSVQNEKLKVRGRLRGIPGKKRDGILGCLKGVPQSKHLF